MNFDINNIDLNEEIDLEKEKKFREYERIKDGMKDRFYKIKERVADIQRLKKSMEEAKARLAELREELGIEGDE